MNNKSSGLGCGLFFLLAIVIYVFQFITANPILWIVVLLVVVGVIVGVRASKRQKRSDIMTAFLATADKLDALAADQAGPKDITLTLRKDERALFAMYNAPLVEYASSGSTYSGTNLGVSVPLFGSVRGNIGGSQGSFTKNPEELTIVDTGLVVFTTQRIVFTGAKLVRDWEFSRILNLDIGENGSSVRIAVSGNGRTSGFQSGPLEFGVGLPAGYAHTWFDEGEEAARAWLRRTAKNMREAVETFKQQTEKSGPVRPLDLDHSVQPKQVEPVTEPDPDDPASSKM
jgi:hypothetical protein